MNKNLNSFVLLWSTLAAVTRQERGYEGMYSGRVENYEVVVPIRLRGEDGGSGGRGKRGAGVEYEIVLRGRREIVELTPSPSLLGPGATLRRGSRPPKPLQPPQCHFRGVIKGRPSTTTVALSTCHDRLVGVLRTPEGEYWLEPVKSHNSSTGYPHLLYKRAPPVFRHGKKYKNRRRKRRKNMNCGTREPRRWVPTTLNPVSSSDISLNWLEEREKIESLGKMRVSRSVSLLEGERNVETLVVADSSMTEFHKSMDLETYLLTIMNMVSSTYQDPSIGRNIKIVVVRIIILEDDVSEGLNITVNADDALQNFCNWQLKQNPTDEKHPNHHDVAILITRKDICARKNTPCSTLGIAHVGGMCQPEKSCNINEDNGIILAHTITHELGHNFGMYHDTPQAGCEGREGPILHVMTPNFEADTTHIAWSGCSRRDLGHFLNKGKGHCLEDMPTSKKSPNESELHPGAVFTAENQCKLQFGSNSTVCISLEEVCSILWCTDNEECVTNLNPAAEGTSCGNGKFCLNQKCLKKGPWGDEGNIEEGGCGEWGSWSSCSRTCGGGVSFKERDCLGTLSSLGERRKYRICNIKPCPEGSPTFRSEQCSAYNYQHSSGTNSTFVPFLEKTFGETALDGTPCGQHPGSRDMCISGTCRRIGCDWVIDSNATEDKCGICQGDGSECNYIEGEFIEKVISGQTEVIIIPQNARNIIIDEKVNSRIYISIAAVNKDIFYLNEKRESNMPGEFQVGGTVGFYERKKEKEKIIIPGPLKDAIIVYLTNKGKAQNGSLHYKYSLLKAVNNGRRSQSGRKHQQEGTLPSAQEWKGGSTCRGSSEGSSDNRVGKTKCKGIPVHPQETSSSNQKRWWTGPWRLCSTTCGKGIRRREVLCVGGDGSGGCELHAGPKPKVTSPCNGNPPCPKKGVPFEEEEVREDELDEGDEVPFGRDGLGRSNGAVIVALHSHNKRGGNGRHLPLRQRPYS